MIPQHSPPTKRAGGFAGLTRTLLVVVTMAAMTGVPSIGSFAATRTHAAGASGNANISTTPQGRLDVGMTPTWGLGFINSAVDQKMLVTAMGRPFGASGLYAPLTGWNFPIDAARQVAANGGLLYLNINSWRSVGTKKTCYPYRDVAAGRDDALLQTWVDQLTSFDYANVILTFTHEPTAHNPSQPGCGTAAEYVAAFDHVHTYFTTHGITYPWVWTMVAASFTQGYAQDWQPPPADFQWIAVDGYNRFLRGAWRSPEYIFSAADNYASGLGKPLMIGEIGTVEDPADATRKGDWLTDASNLFDSWGNVAAILWNDSQDYRPDSSSTTLNTWAELSTNDGAPFLSGTNGTPGQTVSVWGTGFSAGETVDVHLDSQTGPLLASAVASADGVVNDVNLPLPTPLPGGDHSLFAIGETSGMNPQSILDVHPAAASNFSIAAGDTWTYHGVGWVPGENVGVSFPGIAAVNQTADATGSVDIGVISPPEPNPGAKVTITAPSFDMNVSYHVIRDVSVPNSGVPQQQVTVSGTGYGASETVNVRFDGKVTTQSFTTDPEGSFSGSLLLDLTFGRHQVTLTGAASHATKNEMILLAPTMNLSPTSGPSGTTVTVDSGPGWIPAESVQLKLGSTVVLTLTANASGSVHGSVVIERHAAGTINLHLTGVKSNETTNAQFKVTAS